MALETKLLRKILDGNVQDIVGTHPRPLEGRLGSTPLIDLGHTAN
jgi:hypothetical protein